MRASGGVRQGRGVAPGPTPWAASGWAMGPARAVLGRLVLAGGLLALAGASPTPAPEAAHVDNSTAVHGDAHAVHEPLGDAFP